MVSKIIDTARKTMLQNQDLIYVAPCQELKRYVAKYSISFASAASTMDNLTLIPDASGCLIFTYDGSELTSLLWGATSKTFVVKNDMNDYPIQLFIELLPGGLYYLTRLKQIDLTNKQIPLCQINKQLHLHVYEAFESAEDFYDLIDKINLILFSYFQSTTLPQALLSAIDNIKQSKGCLSAKEIAEKEFYSDRHMNRLFNDYIGINVKTLSNIVRINYVLQQMRTEKKRLPVDIAQISGFYDQAHYIRTFKLICGVTPNKFHENMSDLYNEYSII